MVNKDVAYINISFAPKNLYFYAKYAPNYDRGSAPDPDGGTFSAPSPLSW